MSPLTPMEQLASPGRKTGCGLKREIAMKYGRSLAASPGRKTGCGLKHDFTISPGTGTGHHPVERPGAD